MESAYKRLQKFVIPTVMDMRLEQAQLLADGAGECSFRRSVQSRAGASLEEGMHSGLRMPAVTLATTLRSVRFVCVASGQDSIQRPCGVGLHAPGGLRRDVCLM